MKNIYQHTECLTDKMLIGYHKNELLPKEMNMVENHLIDCEMCRDVLDGISEMKNIDKLPIIVETLNQKIDEKTSNRRKLIGFRKLKYIGLAASIIILVGLSIFLGGELKKSQEMAMCDNIEQTKTDFENNKIYKEKFKEELKKEPTEKKSKNTDVKKIELKKDKKVEDIIEIVEDNEVIESDVDFEFEKNNDELIEEVSLNEKDKKLADDELQLDIIEEADIVSGESVAKGVSRTNVEEVYMNEEEIAVSPPQNSTIARKEKNNNSWNGRNIWTKKDTKKSEAQAPVMEDFTNTSDLIYTARNYQELGDYSNSIIYYDIILENKNDPYYYEAKYNKAKILIEENKNDEALTILKELSEEKNNFQDSAKVLIKKISN